ncbi:MAG: hypothetical protein A3F72_16525 [Bacteroidetes bacterium RIFCSPLOWO2_12_FULL_35_15]|nr:MAG: hypothetical protein A3F72_16525 [Bacteroidetes bacterium RIFCSPLOWO2_12_FULL_35_15]
MTFICTSVFAQVPPQFINFSGKAMNGSVPVTTAISIRVKIIQQTTLSSVYHETFSGIIPDVNGFYSIKIGSGYVILGPLANINWGSSTHNLEVAIDPSNGVNYSGVSTTPMLTVPYSFYSEKSGGGAILGTPGYVLKFTDTKFASTSKIFDNGTCVAIGSNNPGFQKSFAVYSDQIGGSYFTSNVESYQTRAVKAELNLLNLDAVAIEGVCANSDYYGIGGEFTGGYMGCIAKVVTTGSKSYTGIEGLVLGGGNPKTGMGVYGRSNGAGINYGVYGTTNGGGTTNYAGYFAGNVTVTGTFANVSDMKFKSDIQPISNSLSTLMKLEPKTYSFKTKEFKSMNLPEGKHYGFVAQELEKIMPELVTNNIQAAEYNEKKEKTSDEINFKAVNYIEMISLLVASVQEQEKVIEKMQMEIEKLKKTNPVKK